MLHSLNTNSDHTNSDMSVLERRRLRFPQEPVVLYDQQSDNLFSGFNSDQGLGELLLIGPTKPDPDSKTGSNDGFRSILTRGPGFETPIPRTVSCPAQSSAAGTKKRKKPDKTQSPKVTEPENSGEKKTKGCSEGESKTTAQNSTTTTVANASPKPDYIHVRARRGQATDSHSLAERVRREKISERMKFLQDLVPGCNKITGKAGMLDEIINYVQSLQRQVEFLSMKIAVINPRLDFDVDGSNYVMKEMYASEAFNHVPIQFNEMAVNPMDLILRRTVSTPQTLLNVNQQQLSWEDEVQIHNLYAGMEYQMAPFVSQSFTDLLESGHVKMEM